MKLNIRVLAVFLMIFMGFQAYAQQEQPDLMEQAEMEADRLQRLLYLEDWQTFYVDSILKHDYSAMLAEYEQLQKAKVSNASIYQLVQDKWKDKMDEAFRKVFNDEQWSRYLKNGAGKAQKGRAKRKAKAEGK
ncbi:MAG: hypothetical protein IKU36_09315 [Bacteroidales bacterium]|nr:hypothetical protein [Bacteroidales bacterium]